MQEAVNKVMAAIAAAVPVTDQPEYYDEDGLKRCGLCGGKLQSRQVWAGKERILPCICDCRKAAMDKEKAQQELEARVRKYKAMGFEDRELEKSNFANDDLSNAAISKAMKNYVANWARLKADGQGLILYGTVGTGKTYYAACVVNALLGQGVPCLMTNFARLTNTLWSISDKQEYIDSLNQFSLLVIDDLAAERDTEYMNDMVFQIIDARYRSGLPMIITTNLTAAELKAPKNISRQRVFNRILEKCHPVEVTGINRRNKKLRDSYPDMQHLLFD